MFFSSTVKLSCLFSGMTVFTRFGMDGDNIMVTGLFSDHYSDMVSHCCAHWHFQQVTVPGRPLLNFCLTFFSSKDFSKHYLTLLKEIAVFKDVSSEW